MANEEQRRAFASYMGTGGASQGQPVPQYPGNPYLFNVQQFPAAPTPPPAAPSSVASYPGHRLPQRPPPLGQAGAPQGQQQMPPPAGPPGYVQVPRSYNAQPPPPPGYNVSWQYTDPNAEQDRRRSGAPAGAMVPASRNATKEIVESRSRQMNEQHHYQQYGQPQAPQPAQAPPPQVEEVAVPVMLCHTCSHCGRMRSAGFHRNHPVVPGKPLVPTLCRRCKKKIKNHHHSRSSYTHIRSCTAEEPCDWPRDCIHVDINHGERRGRQRSREEVYVMRYSPSRPSIVRRSSSQARLGLRVLQQPPRELKTETRVRVSSLSPVRSSRYDEIWPPPDVVRMGSSRSDEVYPAPPDPLPSRTSRTDEVWPPPDVVRTHSYRKIERNPPLRRASSRIIELSPSPPPPRTSSTRVVYRSESQEHRPRSRSASPVRVRLREERRNEDVEARITAHPSPYRPVLPDHRTLRREFDEPGHNDFMSRRRQESPNRSILKPGGMDRETSYRRRASMRASQESTHVEVGGPRVHFGQERREERPAPESRDRPRYANEQRSNSENYEHYHEYSRHRYVDEPPVSPPIEDFDRLRIRRSPPLSQSYEEIRIDRARRISPSPPPPPPPRRYEEVRLRHVSPLPPRGRTPRPPPSPPSPKQPQYSGYRHVSRTRSVERVRSLTPPPSRRKEKEKDWEDLTDSESAASGEITEVRSWRGIDENGQPATFVEERRTVRMIEQESERGGDFGPMTERLATRSWRDV